MDDQPLLPEVTTEPKRSQLLTVLCILTFVGSGMNAFSSLIIAAFYDTFLIIMEPVYEHFNLPGIEMLLNASAGYFLVSGLLYAGSLAGALVMWQQRKIGFHIYTIALILLLIAQMYFMDLSGPPVIEVLFSGLFILLYSTQLKQMH